MHSALTALSGGLRNKTRGVSSRAHRAQQVNQRVAEAGGLGHHRGGACPVRSCCARWWLPQGHRPRVARSPKFSREAGI